MLPISSRCHQSGVLVRGFFPARACGDTGDIEQRDLLPAQGDVQEARVGQVQGILRKFSAFWESSMHFGKTQGLSGKAQFLLGRVSAFGKVLWLLCRLSAFWGGSVPFREAQCVSGRLSAARRGSARLGAVRCAPGAALPAGRALRRSFATICRAPRAAGRLWGLGGSGRSKGTFTRPLV